MNNITYVFSQNRRQNYINNKIEAREFYYGVDFLGKDNHIEIIEFEKSNNPFLELIDRVISKLLSLPFYSSKLTNIKNFKTIIKTDHLFLVNEGVGMSSIFLLIFSKIFNRNLKVSLFVMGLYSKKLNFANLKFFHNLLIKFLIFYIDNVLFLGKAEMKQAIKLHRKKTSSKFKFVPFCVDDEFWLCNEKYENRKKDQIIFVGNDSNRDYELLIKIVKKLPNFKFIIVSSSNALDNLKLPNVEIYKGSWGNSEISDSKLRDLYEHSKLSIIPLKDSFQPSGQSVALQSMSLGIPVLITKTKGFWDSSLFDNEENIYFIDSSKEAVWAELINNLYRNEESLNHVSKNARNTISDNYSLKLFFNSLLKVLKN